jgi:hypothetical protein
LESRPFHRATGAYTIPLSPIGQRRAEEKSSMR